MCVYFPQDEIGNNFDQIGSVKQNSDFHLDTTSTWEFSNIHDISHGLFRVKHSFFCVYIVRERKLTSYVKN
jgi:hypothetical protein